MRALLFALRVRFSWSITAACSYPARRSFSPLSSPFPQLGANLDRRIGRIHEDIRPTLWGQGIGEGVRPSLDGLDLTDRLFDRATLVRVFDAQVRDRVVRFGFE